MHKITTGFGDIVPLSTQETLWCIISMYIGLLITACSIANLQLLVTNMDAALTAFQHKMELLKYYMQYRKLSNHLQNRITSFYDYQWDLLKGVDEEQVRLIISLHLYIIIYIVSQTISHYLCLVF